MIKAMQDPEFLKEMQEMPARILAKLNRIDSLVTAIAKEHGLEISEEGMVYYTGSDIPDIDSHLESAYEERTESSDAE